MAPIPAPIPTPKQTMPRLDQEERNLIEPLLGKTLEEIERLLVLGTLQFLSDHRINAAKVLGITDRTIRNKVSKYKYEDKISRSVLGLD